MARCNCSGRCLCRLAEGDNVTITGDGSDAHPYLITASGGDGLPAAAAFTTTTGTDPFTSDDITIVQFTAKQVGIAIGRTGDTFPRLLILSDNSIYFGEGSDDPSGVNGASVYFAGGDLNLQASSGGTITHASDMSSQGDFYFASSSIGPILVAPDLTQYRLSVNNDGSLSTTVV